MFFRVQPLHVVVLSLVIVTVLIYMFYADNDELFPLNNYSRGCNFTIIRQTFEESQPLRDANTTVKISVVKEYSSKSSSPDTDILHKIYSRYSKIAGNFSSGNNLTSALYEGGHQINNSELCPNIGSNIKIIILITSAPHNYDARRAIRMTWGHYNQKKDIVMAFVVGSTLTTDVQTALQTESEVNGDIIQGNFVDSYNNLTLKTLSILEWVGKYCFRAHFLLKSDDDMYINVGNLLTFVEHIWNIPRTIYGRLAVKWIPNRDKSSKYYIPPEQYYPSFFPDFTSGPAYLITTDIVYDLYKHTMQHIFVQLEDVFITGIVSDALNISRVNVKEFYNIRINFDVCTVKNAISIHDVKYAEQFLLWTKQFDLNEKCRLTSW